MMTHLPTEAQALARWQRLANGMSPQEQARLMQEYLLLTHKMVAFVQYVIARPATAPEETP